MFVWYVKMYYMNSQAYHTSLSKLNKFNSMLKDGKVCRSGKIYR